MPSVTELLIILVIVALLFGTKKLRSMGGDLGGAVKGFRSALQESETEEAQRTAAEQSTEMDTSAHAQQQSKD